MLNMLMPFLPLVAITSQGASVTADTIMSILTAVTSTMSIESIVAFLAGIIAVAMAFVFLWWGVRKGFRAIMGAVTKGRLKI